MDDFLQHPDLVEMGRRLRARLDAVLEAEQQAAAVAVRRTATMRDRLLDTEDAGRAALVWLVGGGRLAGQLVVGVDHVEVIGAQGTTLVPLASLLAVHLP